LIDDPTNIWNVLVLVLYVDVPLVLSHASWDPDLVHRGWTDSCLL